MTKENREYFGRKFYKDHKTGYWISCDYSKDRPRIRAHRWVWENIHGKIPKGYHVHHKDDDKSNNDINNLELIERIRHMKHHMQNLSEERIEKMRIHCEKIRPLTKVWHASEKGKRWHKIHAIKNNFGNWQLNDYKCEQCGKDYKSKLKAKGRTRFCGNNCKSKWRRVNGIDNIEVKCYVCGKIYKKNKYARSETCSRECGVRIKHL